MNEGSKNYYSIFKAGLFLAILLLFFASCRKNILQTQHYRGKTMGTYYSIKYLSASLSVSQQQIDSLLIEINNQVSTYIPTSTISKINRSTQENINLNVSEKTNIFIKNIELSQEIYNLTNGYFDPTVMPLVNFWGFGYTGRTTKDTTQLDSLRMLVGFNKWSFTHSNKKIKISKPKYASIDFSAIAKGLGIDQIASFLESKNIDNYFIDIGGETRAKGTKNNNQDWIIGINTPEENSDIQDVKLLIKLKNEAIATSGNYRNFYNENGSKYVHTINPLKGYPEQSKLLSASIITSSCGKADGIATACMVMGLNQSIVLIKHTPDIEGILIFINEKDELKTWYSKNIKKNIVLEK